MSNPNIKHIEMLCPLQPCKYKGFVQVVIDPDNQSKIDELANKKLTTELTKQHKEGQHNA